VGSSVFVGFSLVLVKEMPPRLAVVFLFLHHAVSLYPEESDLLPMFLDDFVSD
jgi:hypothetical protein